MKWWKKSEDFYHFSLFEYDAPPPTGSVANEIFSGKKAYARDEAKQDVFNSGWFKMKDENENDSRFFEFCLYAK